MTLTPETDSGRARVSSGLQQRAQGPPAFVPNGCRGDDHRSKPGGAHSSEGPSRRRPACTRYAEGALLGSQGRTAAGRSRRVAAASHSVCTSADVCQPHPGQCPEASTQGHIHHDESLKARCRKHSITTSLNMAISFLLVGILAVSLWLFFAKREPVDLKAGLSGVVYWVTGASSGIGEAISRTVVENGGKVILSARRGDVLSKLASELGDNAQVLAMDLTDHDNMDAMVERARELFGTVDVMVHNGATLLPQTCLHTDDCDRFRWNEHSRKCH